MDKIQDGWTESTDGNRLFWRRHTAERRRTCGTALRSRSRRTLGALPPRARPLRQRRLRLLGLRLPGSWAEPRPPGARPPIRRVPDRPRRLPAGWLARRNPICRSFWSATRRAASSSCARPSPTPRGSRASSSRHPSSECTRMPPHPLRCIWLPTSYRPSPQS